MKALQQWIVAQGTPPEHLTYLKRAAGGTGRLRDWTVPKTVRPGDRIAFYLVHPQSAFVAVGKAEGPPWLVEDPRDGWHGSYYTRISGVRILPTPVPLQTMRDAIPEWKYLRFLRRHAVVPLSLCAKFEETLLRSRAVATAARVPLKAVENLTAEVKVVTRTRSEPLRRQALALAAGICCVCGVDFGRYLNGRGLEALQVHHRRQLAASSAPRITTVQDLAVVYANCHSIIHANPRRALRVETLARMLSTARSRQRASNPPMQRTGSARR